MVLQLKDISRDDRMEWSSQCLTGFFENLRCLTLYFRGENRNILPDDTCFFQGDLPNGSPKDLRVIKIAQLRKGSTEGADWANSDVPEQYVNQVLDKAGAIHIHRKAITIERA